MLVLRILGVVAILLIGGALVTFLVTRDRRWLRFAVQVLKYAVILALMIVGLIAVERLMVGVV
jgi:hypothetical protein